MSETQNREVGNTVMNKTFQWEDVVDSVVLSIRVVEEGIGIRSTRFDKWMKCKSEETSRTHKVLHQVQFEEQ